MSLGGNDAAFSWNTQMPLVFTFWIHFHTHCDLWDRSQTATEEHQIRMCTGWITPASCGCIVQAMAAMDTYGSNYPNKKYRGCIDTPKIAKTSGSMILQIFMKQWILRILRGFEHCSRSSPSTYEPRHQPAMIKSPEVAAKNSCWKTVGLVL